MLARRQGGEDHVSVRGLNEPACTATGLTSDNMPVSPTESPAVNHRIMHQTFGLAASRCEEPKS